MVVCWNVDVLFLLFVLYGMTSWSSAGPVVSSAFCLFCIGDLVVVCWDGGVLSFFVCFVLDGGRLLGWWCPQLFVGSVWDDLIVVWWGGSVLSFLFVLFGMTWWSSAGMVVSSAFCLFC